MEIQREFHILRLPFLPFQHVVLTSHAREQYKLATLSKRMKFLVRSAHSKRDVNAIVQFGTLTTFILQNEKMENKYSFILWPPILRVYPTLDSIRQQIRFIKEAFNLQSFSASFLYSYPAGLEFIAIALLKQENLRLGEMQFCRRLSSKVTKRVLKECSDAQKLEIENASHVTMNDLIEYSMNCERVYLSRQAFTSEELNKFLKRWVEDSRIEIMCCRIKDPSSFLSIFDGLDAQPVLKAMCTFLSLIMEYEPGECFMIKQTSEVKAFVIFIKYNEVILSTKFTLDFTNIDYSRTFISLESDVDEDVEDADLRYIEPPREDSETNDSSEEDTSEDSTDDEGDDDSNGGSIDDKRDDASDSEYGVRGENSSDDDEESSGTSSETEDKVPYENLDDAESDADNEDETSGEEKGDSECGEKEIAFSEEEEDSSGTSSEAGGGVPYVNFDYSGTDADDEQSDAEDN